jgi:16S rRNA (guanine966-N2)-methyltransferase
MAGVKILAGRHKGTLLKTLEGEATRPTTGRIAENLFNLIAHHRWDSQAFLWSNQTVLDICAGSGRLGLESYSRGAKSVVFLEKNPDAVKIIQQNIAKISAVPSLKTYCHDATKSFMFPKSISAFSLVFCDAPYHSEIFTKAMTWILPQNILAEGALIIHEDHHNTPAVSLPGLHLALEKQYGITMLRFYGFSRSNPVI